MLPYLEAPVLEIGGLVIPAFGLLVLAGVVAGLAWAAVRAPRERLSRGAMVGALGWAVLAGFGGARAGQLLVLRPERFAAAGPAAFLDPGAGLSSMFGIAAGTLALCLILGVRRVPLLPALDLAVEALAVGWAFGRLGCALVHDHLGARTDFVLAVAHPDGPRHDLGLYEWVFTVVVLLPGLRIVTRRAPVAGARLVAACVLYAPVRFALDELRATDLADAERRFAGMTSGQWGSLAILGLGLTVAAVIRRRRRRGLARPGTGYRLRPWR